MTERSAGNLIFPSTAGGRGYFPQTGQYTQNAGYGQGNGAGYQAGEADEDFDENQSSMQFYGKALHPVSSALKGIMEFALEMNPAEMLRQGLQGTGLWGKPLSAGQRLTTLAWLGSGSIAKGGLGLAKFGGAKFLPIIGMLAGRGGDLSSDLAKIYKKYPAEAFGCTKAARKALKALKETYPDARCVGIVHNPANTRAGTYYFQEGATAPFSTNGYHEAVFANGRYYDALTGSSGATPDEYWRLWKYVDSRDMFVGNPEDAISLIGQLHRYGIRR